MDTAQHHPAAHRCLVFLHPAAASNPQIIRDIHAATGLIAVAGGNPHAARLVRRSETSPSRGIRVMASPESARPPERPEFSVEEVCRWFGVPFDDGSGPFSGGAA